MRKDTKRFIAYMLMHKHFKLVKKGANWRIEYNGVLLEPSDITIPRDGIMSIRPEFIELFPIHQKY